MRKKHMDGTLFQQKKWYRSVVILLPCLMLLVFEKALKAKKFPGIWKNANVAPVHKKEENDLSKKLLSNWLTPSKSTHICQFAMNSTSKIHVGSS